MSETDHTLNTQSKKLTIPDRGPISVGIRHPVFLDFFQKVVRWTHGEIYLLAECFLEVQVSAPDVYEFAPVKLQLTLGNHYLGVQYLSRNSLDLRQMAVEGMWISTLHQAYKTLASLKDFEGYLLGLRK